MIRLMGAKLRAQGPRLGLLLPTHIGSKFKILGYSFGSFCVKNDRSRGHYWQRSNPEAGLSWAQWEAGLGQVAWWAGFIALQQNWLLEDRSLMSHFSEIRANVQLLLTVLVGEGEEEWGGAGRGRRKRKRHFTYIKSLFYWTMAESSHFNLVFS